MRKRISDNNDDPLDHPQHKTPDATRLPSSPLLSNEKMEENKEKTKEDGKRPHGETPSPNKRPVKNQKSTSALFPEENWVLTEETDIPSDVIRPWMINE